MKKNEGGGEGLKAKSSGDTESVFTGLKSRSTKKKRSPFVDSAANGGATVCSSKTKTKTARGGGFYSGATMYSKSDATTTTSKSFKTTTGMSISGKSFDAKGNHFKNDPRAVLMPVHSVVVDKAIGGAVAFSQVDCWTDYGLNKRASCMLTLNPGVQVPGEVLQCRTSTLDPHVVVLSFILPDKFTNIDKKLEYLLERIATAFPDTKGDRFACMRVLKSQGRYISAKANLKSLLGSVCTHYVTEHRLTIPFEPDASIVTQDEDAIFHGFFVDEDVETGECNLFFELKEKGKPFAPVLYDGASKESVAPPSSARKSMFSDFKMGSIPENITFASPIGKHRSSTADDDDDDNSTIATNTMADNQSAAPRTPRKAAAKANAAGFKTTGLDEEDDSDDSSWDDELGEDEDDMDVDGDNKVDEAAANAARIKNLEKELEEMRSIFNGATMKSKSEDSNDVSSSSKKKKRNVNSSSSVTSSKTDATRGTTNREEKRKTPTKRNEEFKDKSE